MASKVYKPWIVVGFFALSWIQVSYAKLVVDIKFERYTHDCDEDPWPFDSNCDPMFTFCLDRPSQSLSMDQAGCYYQITGESGHYQNQNDIRFGTNINGIANPWKVVVNRLMDQAVMLTIRTRDDDTSGGDDHMVTFSRNFSANLIRPSESQATYEARIMTIGGHSMWLKIRMYCEPYYYGSTCMTFCKARNDDQGHYTCEEITGKKLCLKGWTGTDCNTDIDECQLNYCTRGSCENEPGDYFCHCPENYTGKNCSLLENPCDGEPCLNNGTCTWVNSTQPGLYECNCTEGWVGQDCETKLTVCTSQPCLNGGECTVINTTTGYNCTCTENFTGNLCETEITTTTTMTTTPIRSPPANSSATGGENSGFMADQDEKVEAWIPAVICVCLLIVIIILIICFVVRRRRRKQKEYHETMPASDQTVVVFSGENLAFENNMYNDVNRRNEIQASSIVPTPTTPSDDELFNPTKPTFYPESLDEGGATGGYHEMDADGYVKPQKSVGDVTDEKEQLRAFHSLQTQSERAEANPYSDFDGLKSITKCDQDEPHYQDLDEVGFAMQGLDNAVKEEENEHDNEDDDDVFFNRPLCFTSGSAIDNSLDVADQLQSPDFSRGFTLLQNESSTDTPTEGHYSEVPSNTPKNSIQRHDPYTEVPLNTPKNSIHQHEHYTEVPLNTPKNSMKKDIPLPAPPSPPPRNGLNSVTRMPEESLYAEPQIKPSEAPLSRAGSHYSEVPNNSFKRTDPFAEDIFEDDDDFNVDLPDVTPAPVFGEKHYDSPSFRRDLDRNAILSSEYDSPRNSTKRPTPDHPETSEGSPALTRSSKLRPREYDEVNISDGYKSEDDLPMAPPPPNMIPNKAENETEEIENEPTPVSVRDGFDFDDEQEENLNDDDGAELTPKSKEPMLYLENTVFSLQDEM